VLLSRDLPYAAVDERKSCLDRPVPVDSATYLPSSDYEKSYQIKKISTVRFFACRIRYMPPKEEKDEENS
jgi:hypothetical protein